MLLGRTPAAVFPRRIFIENPSLCDLIVLRPSLSPRTMPVCPPRLDRELAALVNTGFSMEDALHAYMTLSVYPRGCVIQDRLYSAATRSSTDEEDRQSVLMLSERLSLRVMAESHKYWSSTFSTDIDFEAGLSIIIDGLGKRTS